MNTTTPSVTTFEDFGLAEPILRAVTELGYREPTPIQVQAIPIVMQGRDVMGAAQTGTGKTAGFALPILQRLMVHANTSASPARHPVRALILAPTRELADQIYANVREYAKYTGLRAAVVFGGVDIAPQIAALRQGAEVVIATPGRLLDHVGQRTISLSGADVFVMDEADRMLDMGFLPDIQRIINLLPPVRQNLMFSATFSGDIRKLAETFLKQPVSIEVARRNAAAENVEQLVFRVADAGSKRAAVAQLVRERGLAQVIVFTNTKIGAGRLARELEKDGLNASAIHGDKSQQERLATLEAFKKGEVAILVATDVAARGLDIAELPAVINYDLPYSPEDYIHRIGRTGRAGASGVALSLMSAADERLLDGIQKLLKRELPQQTLVVAGARPERASGDFSARSSEGRPPREARPPRDSSDTPREARPPRESREPREHREPREASGAPRRDSRPSYPSRAKLPGYSQDPFFFKPYEPPTQPEAVAEESGQPTNAASMRRRQSARPVAALLGGKKA
ncbi:MAG TPA: DEAD/DEAH box helicase [Burkholderiaceae bacterium]|nr:DEAD/DEAH box helicase [Burkholderiaceae bacterium]